MSFEPPLLPLPYTELGELSVLVAEHGVPDFLNELSALFGWRTPPITKRDRMRMAKMMRSFVLGSRGYFLAAAIFRGEVKGAAAAYAVVEGQVRQYLQLQRRLKDDEDACAVMLQIQEEVAAPPRRAAQIDGYAEARAAVDAFAMEVSRSAHGAGVDDALGEWVRLPVAKRVLQFGERLGTTARTWRFPEPRRLTQKLVTDLTNEYRDAAPMIEQLLARFLGIALAARGEPVTWKALSKRSLSDLLKLAEKEAAYPALLAIANAVHLGVRNVIAHGHPTFARGRKRIEFLNDDGDVEANWTPTEFYANTRRLSACMLAMFKFDDQLQLVRSRTLFQALARQVREEMAPPR